MQDDKLSRARRHMADRATMPSHIVGFLLAWKQAMEFDYFLHEVKAPLPKLVGVIVAAHIATYCVRALETLFRDCFVFVAQRDRNFAAAAATTSKGKVTAADIQALAEEKPEFHDLLAAKRALQNLEAVSNAFEPLFGKPMLEFMGEERFLLHRAHEGKHVLIQCSLNELMPTWRDDLEALFPMRHEIIHNAHAALPEDQDLVARMAGTVLIFGQLLAAAIGSRLNEGLLCIQAPKPTVLELAKNVKAAKEGPRPPGTVSGHWVLGNDGLAYAGPFIFFAGDMPKTSFDLPDGPLAEPGILHIVDLMEEGKLRLRTLWAIRAPGDEGAASQ